MKFIKKLFTVCLAISSITSIQASGRTNQNTKTSGSSHNFLQLTRQQQVAIENNRILNTTPVRNPLVRAIASNNTSQSSSPLTLDFRSNVQSPSPTSEKTQSLMKIHQQEIIDLKNKNIHLINRITETELNYKRQLTALTALVDKQDIELVNQSNEIIRLKSQIKPIKR